MTSEPFRERLTEESLRGQVGAGGWLPRSRIADEKWSFPSIRRETIKANVSERLMEEGKGNLGGTTGV